MVRIQLAWLVECGRFRECLGNNVWMISVLASSVVYRGLEPRSVQTKDYKINICCFSAKHTTANHYTQNE
jgi:hypothetical protein